MKTLTLLLAVVFSFGAFVPKAEAAPKKMVAVILMMDDGDDKKVATTIYTTLMAAEKVSSMMGIEMHASDESVDDVFVFNLESEEQKDLTMKMFDEEGYQLAAHRVLDVNEGNNYKGLNVSSLQDGTYMFQITDKEGREMTRKVTVDHTK